MIWILLLLTICMVAIRLLKRQLTAVRSYDDALMIVGVVWLCTLILCVTDFLKDREIWFFG